jgi:hypothetical protein
VKIEKATERYETFAIDYKKVSLETFDLEDIEAITSSPSFSLLKSIKGLCKLMISRIKFNQVEEGLLFCQEAYSNLVGTPTTLYSVGIDQELTQMYLQRNVDTQGKKNKFELPLSKAFKADEDCK